MKSQNPHTAKWPEGPSQYAQEGPHMRTQEIQDQSMEDMTQI